MVKVLVFGASGYIGSATSLALQRAGHKVVGVSRKKTIPELERNEVESVQGDIGELKSLQSYIENADVIIDNVLDFTKGISVNKDLLAAIEAASKKSGVRKRYIYTSGCLVYGNQPGKVLSETDPLYTIPVLKPRADFEQQTIKSTEVDGTVIRPGFVYGGKTSPHFFTPNEKGQWTIDGDPDRSWSWIHIQDLAGMYVLAVDAPASVVRGEIFNAGDSTRMTFAQMKTLVARTAGFKGDLVKVEAGTDILSVISAQSTVMSFQKATKLLGWQPKLGPFQDHIESVYRAFKAHQSAAAENAKTAENAKK